MIDVKNLSKSFGDHLVLDGIDQHIDPGEKVVVLGPSGSGKSTFLRCLNLLETPTGGSITFEGTEITDPKVNIDQVRQQMGMVFQHFNLFPNMTIRKNITLAPVRTGLMKQEEADETATALLKRVDLLDKADAYPNQLSGGQKQRIAIAGVIAMEPACIVLDEATAMLDPIGRQEVLSTVHRLNREKGITVVLITHHMNEAEEADRVLVMNGGQVAMDGTPREVFTRIDELRAMGLTVPDTVDLLDRLRRDGLDVPLDALTVEACADAIAAAMKGTEGEQ